MSSLNLPNPTNQSSRYNNFEYTDKKVFVSNILLTLKDILIPSNKMKDTNIWTSLKIMGSINSAAYTTNYNIHSTLWLILVVGPCSTIVTSYGGRTEKSLLRNS